MNRSLEWRLAREGVINRVSESLGVSDLSYRLNGGGQVGYVVC
jgi:hypothetical protein